MLFKCPLDRAPALMSFHRRRRVTLVVLDCDKCHSEAQNIRSNRVEYGSHTTRSKKTVDCNSNEVVNEKGLSCMTSTVSPGDLSADKRGGLYYLLAKTSAILLSNKSLLITCSASWKGFFST